MIAERFLQGGRILSCASYGQGHINDTFKVDTEKTSFILQRINRHVFHEPARVMENLLRITEHIEKRLKEEGTDPSRRVLHVNRTNDGRLYYVDEEGEYWRALTFVDGAVCFERAENEDIFREGALAFGSFQKLLSDFPASRLYETIPRFHDTGLRLEQFVQALSADPAGRADRVREETAFLLERKELAGRLSGAAARGEIPLRVSHNDTKLNNVLIDKKSGHWLCVLDLDTVMPGLSLTDFGDAIRFGASTGAEDEPDLDKVHFDRHLYEVYREGFLEGCGGSLLDKEICMLPDGAMVITYEQALRFLTDYLSGDVYYKTAREDHNLDRARTQIRLLQEMEAEFEG